MRVLAGNKDLSITLDCTDCAFTTGYRMAVLSIQFQPFGGDSVRKHARWSRMPR
jgi:hypothetical protein